MVSVAVEALRLAQTELLVLASGGVALAAVDLTTGGLIRAPLPPDCTLAPFDVATTALADLDDRDPAHPEAVALTEPLEVTGQIRGRKAERYIRPLLHPPDEPLLGLTGIAVPYWTLCGDRPSLAIIDPGGPIEIIRHARRLHCFFEWKGHVIDLPVMDRRVSQSMARRGQQALRIRRRFVVALTPPHDGNCYKVVVGLLPRN
jgi:hypothetical protein